MGGGVLLDGGVDTFRRLISGVPAGLEAFFRDMDRDAVDLDALAHRHGVSFL